MCVFLLGAQCFSESTMTMTKLKRLLKMSCTLADLPPYSHSGSALCKLVFKVVVILSLSLSRFINLVFPAFNFGLPVWIWTTDLSFLTESFNVVFVKHQLKDCRSNCLQL